MHIGGFSGKFNCLQTASVSLTSSPVEAQKKRKSVLIIKTNVEEVFDNPKKIGVNYFYIHNGPQMYQDISANYKNMFTLDKVIN